MNLHWSVSPILFTKWRCSLYRVLTIWRVDCICEIGVELTLNVLCNVVQTRITGYLFLESSYRPKSEQ